MRYVNAFMLDFLFFKKRSPADDKIELNNAYYIVTRTTRYKIENNILISRVIPFTIINIKDAEENEKARMQLIGDNKYPILLDIRKMRYIDEEARKYTQQAADRNNLLAAAILIESDLSKLLGNFALTINKPDIPTRLFSSEETAIEWLKNFIV